MKKLTAFVLALTVVLFFAGCDSGGNTDSLHRDDGISDSYSEAEINEIMDIVEAYFKREFEGCTLKELTYDEEYSNKVCVEWADQYQADRAIVLTSTFDVDSSGGDGSLEPNSTYENWQWILTQNGSENWILQTWGY